MTGVIEKLKKEMRHRISRHREGATVLAGWLVPGARIATK